MGFYRLHSDLTGVKEDTAAKFIFDGLAYASPLRLQYVASTCANNSTVTVSFTAFPHGVFRAIPFCSHANFGTSSTVDVVSLSNGSITLHQCNAQSAGMAISALIFGY